MSFDNLTFWKGLSSELHGYSLEEVYFVGETEKVDGENRVVGVSDYYGSYEPELDGLPTVEELTRLLAEGHVVEMVPSTVTAVGGPKQVTVVICDATGNGFTGYGRDQDSVYRQTFDQLPWPFAPTPGPGEYVVVGGSPLRVVTVFYRFEQPTEIYLNVEDCDQPPEWHEGVRAAGFVLGPESE